ncbi:MAG: Hpt domain-containing protein [bacterium]
MNEEFQEQFNLLRKSYADKIPSRILRIKIIEKELLKNNWNDETLIKELYQLVHSLAGSSAMFGFLALSDTAHELELFLKSIIKTPILFPDKQYALVSTFIKKIEQAFSE